MHIIFEIVLMMLYIKIDPGLSKLQLAKVGAYFGHSVFQHTPDAAKAYRRGPPAMK